MRNLEQILRQVKAVTSGNQSGRGGGEFNWSAVMRGWVEAAIRGPILFPLKTSFLIGESPSHIH